MARDKRVVYSAILGPVILIFLFLFLFGFLKETVTKPKSQTLHVVSGRSDNLFVEALRKSGTLDIREVDSVEEGRKLLSAGKAKVVLLPRRLRCRACGGPDRHGRSALRPRPAGL